MDAKIQNICVRGISTFVPSNVEDNYKYFSLLGERRVKKQVRLTGVRKRHTSEKYQRASDLCICAANYLLDKLKWERESIGVLVYVTQKGDYLIPSTAIALQSRLGLSKECIAFDINLGCSAFNYGIHTVSSLLNTMPHNKRGLCLIADRVDSLSSKREFDAETISFSMLSGSAGSVVALEKTTGEEMIFSGMCDGLNYDAIIKRSRYCDTTMQGNKVFDFAINDVSDCIIAFKERNKLSENDIDFYVFHQAQKLILDSIADSCELPSEKVLFSLKEYGNTSGASVPLTVCANVEKMRSKEKVRLLLCGFGVGLSCGITYLEVQTKDIFPVMETDWHYDEDKKPDKELRDTTILLLGADSDFGGYIANVLDDKSATLILCGKNKSQLLETQESLFWESSLICYDSEEGLLSKLMDTKDLHLDGIVGNLAPEICEELIRNNVLDKYGSIVLLEDKIVDKVNLEAYCRRTDNENSYVRVNVIVYDSTHFEVVAKSWANVFLEAGLPADMLRPYYLGNSIIWLLSKEAKFISNSIIQVDDNIE